MRFNRGRRRTAAVVAGMALPLLVAGWSVSASGVTNATAGATHGTAPIAAAAPSPGVVGCPAGSSPAPSPAPSPAAGLPAPVTAVCAPSGPAALTPLIPVGPTATPSARPRPAGTLTPSPAGAPSAPGGIGGPSALASSQSSVLGALLGLLGTPPSVGVEQPTLRHFGTVPTVAAMSATREHSTGAPVAPPSPVPVLLVTAALATLAVAATLGALSVLGGARRRVLRAAGFAAVSLVGAVVLVVAVSTGGGASHSAGVAATVQRAAVAAVPRSVASVAHSVPSAGQALLAQLTALENRIAFDQARVDALSAAAAPTSSSDLAPGVPRGHGSREQLPARAAAQVLEAAIQEEYDLYVTAGHEPAQSAALLAAVSTTPAAERDAVAYDVQAVQVQLAQQSAISRVGVVGAPAGAAPQQLTSPLDGVITQGFGGSPLAFEPAFTYAGVAYPHFHTGIDIAAPFDSPVHAAADGIVALAGAETDQAGHLVGYGNYVVISHAGGLVTLYGHLDQVDVQPGQTVHGGDMIGLEGSSGNSTGPHLHFEVRLGGLLEDPMKYLAARQG